MSKQCFTLAVTGGRPVQFEGDSVADGATFEGDCPADRGFRLTVYHTGATWVGHVEYLTKWKAEANSSTVYVCNDVSSLVDRLIAHDVMQYVVGYPPGRQFIEKAKRLEQSLKLQYAALIGEVLKTVPGASHPAK